jgi:hypothetical protein
MATFLERYQAGDYEKSTALSTGSEPMSDTPPTCSRPALASRRKVFQWGGFPGWERSKNPPSKDLAELSEGLLPL